MAYGKDDLLPAVAGPALPDEPPDDDDHVRERHPEVHHPSAPLGAPHELFVGVVPGAGALHHPPLRGPERGGLAPPGDLGDEPALSQPLAGGAGVVAAIQVDDGALGRPSQRLRRRVEGRGQERRVAWRLAGAVTVPMGMPRASTAVERLVPRFPRSTGLLPAFSPPRGAFLMQQSTATSGSFRPTIRS